MVRIICLLIGYAFGLFQTSYIYGRTKGIDIREHGSGNAGTTNALRTLGKKAGAITLAGDCIKCILAVLTVRLIFGASHPEILKLLTVYAAAGTILGHNFPFYLGFRGGKGIAATAGLIISCSNTLCFPRFHDGLRCLFCNGRYHGTGGLLCAGTAVSL